jgi:amino acid adenylation domain-containing protein
MKLSNFNLLDDNSEDTDFLQFIEDFNATDANYSKDKSVADLFNEQVDKRADATALIFRDQKVSYSQLNYEAEKIATFIQQNGLGKEDIVALMFDKSLEMLYAILGVMKAGATYLPLDPTHPEDRLAYILNDSATKLILTHSFHEETCEKLAAQTDSVITSLSVDGNEVKNQFTTPVIDPDDTLYIIYTSGSTGRPKGCKISHRNVVRLMVNDKHDFDFNANDTWILAHAYYFDFSVWEMYGALLYGGKLIVPFGDEVKDVSKLHHLVKLHKVSVLNQTPLAFNFFMEEEEEQETHHLNEHLRYVIFGGDKLNPTKFKEWSTRYSLDTIKLINMYGITETTVHVTYYQITQQDIETPGVSPIGRPLPETKIYLLNDNLQHVPEGIVGEMYVGGTGVCKGYLNREELTKERFIKSPFNSNEILYRTGDQARWTSDRKLDYLGRIDFQVKIRGFRIEIGEIESVLNTCQNISQGVVVAVQNKDEDQLAAYFVGNDTVSIENLRSEMQRRLPEYMIPAYFVQIDEIPLTSNGKLDKKGLPDPFKNTLLTEANYVAPTNEQEESIVKIWKEQLGVEQIGIEDNFFHIGGDSLKAIRVVVQMNKVLDASVRIADIFTYKTIKNIVANLTEIDSVSKNDYETGLKKIEQIKNFILENNSDELPENYEDIYPLTTIEKGMIFSSMLRPDEPVYYDQFTYNLAIKNKEVFFKAFELMVEKHPILRSLYFMNTFLEPIKIQMKSVDLPIVFEDISGKDTQEQQAIINTYLVNDANSRLQFENDLLWYLKAFLIEENRFYLVWTVHHAMLDGWSENSFVAEFANLCAQENLLNIAALTTLKSTFKDYTAIQLGRETSGDALAFWTKHLAGFTRNKLPFNLSGKRISSELGMRKIQRSFSKETSLAIESLKNRQTITSKTICLAAYAYLMHIISSEKDVVAGVVSNDRPEIEDADKILGCFLNTVPFRVDFEKIKTYQDLLNYFNDYLNTIRQHEIYLVDIANAVGEKSSGNPIFDCIFNYTDFYILENIDQANQNLHYTDREHADFEFVQNNLMTNTLFDVEIDKTLGDYSIGIKYAPAYFRSEDVDYTIELYENILKAFANHTDSLLNASDLLKDEDRNELLYEFNNTTVPYSDTKLMHQLFEENALRFPEHIALKQHTKQLTYSQLNAEANQLAHFMKDKGVQNGDAIGLLCNRNFEMIKGLLAILKVGASYVPVDPSYPKDRQEYILGNSTCQFVLTDEAYEVDDYSGRFINMNTIDYSNLPKENLDIQKSAQDLAYTIYTSGSTGRPKGVMIAHHSAVNLIEWVNTTYHVNTNDCLLFITSVCFDLSVYDIFGMLAAGGSIVIATQEEVRDPELLKKVMKEEKITFWDAVPTTMNYLVDMIETSEPDYVQNDLRLVFMSGDWIPVTLPNRINTYFPNAKNISLGGATEGTVWSNFYPIEHVDSYQISIPYGKPIDNNFFYILDDNKQPVPKGVAGELYIGGVGVALGYANDTEKTDAAFFADPFAKSPNSRMYKTGDLGRMMPDGNMEFLGRKDFQVKIRGFRVELGEIENQLQKNEKVQRAIVLAKDDGNNSNYLCAYVVLREEVDNDQLRQYLAKELPDYMIPSVFVRIEKVPVTSNGKIDRKALPDPSSYIQQKTIVLPSTELEKQLAAIWTTILGLDKIGVNENVFDLGAHSLHAGAFVSRVQKQLNLTIALRELFIHPSIEAQAKIVEANKQTNQFVSIPKISASEYYEVSHAQRRLWVIDQIKDGKSTEYNLPVTFSVKGEFKLPFFEKAIQKVADRHEILRTSFKMINEELKQIIDLNYTFKVDLIETDNEDEVNAVLQKNAYEPFDLRSAPLFRVAVVQKAESEYVISFVMHHIISDGWSMGVLVREIFKYYALFSNNENVSVDELPIQYKDFSAWQNKQLNDSSTQSHKNYWLKKMEGELPLLELPTKIVRPETLSSEAKTIFNTLPKELTQQLKAFCSQHNVSTFMVLQAAVKTLFYRYTNQKDILIGSPIAGREHADLSDQIGFYVNTLALRDQLNPSDSFSVFLQQVKETVLEAFEHQIYPYDKLVDDLGIPRNLNRNALFDVMLVMQNVDEQKNTDQSFVQQVSQQLNIEKLDLDEPQSKFDLTFNFFESDVLMLNLEYRSQLFDDVFVGNIWTHLTILLEQVIQNPTIKINQLNVLSTTEIEMLDRFNQTDAPYPKDKTISQLLNEVFSQIPEKEALLFEGGSWTYEHLNAKANSVAAALKRRGITKGDVVACMMPKQPDLIACMIGVWKVGAIYLPINHTYPEDRISFITEDSNVKMIISDSSTLTQVDVMKPSEIEMSRFDEVVVYAPSDIAYIIYTSGSTGTPKGTLVTHRNAINMAIGHEKAYGLSESHRVMLFSSIAFDASIGEILAPLLTKGSIAIASETVINDIEEFYSFTEQFNVNSVWLTPSYINILDETRMKHIANIYSVGEAAIVKDAVRFGQYANFYNGYGPTETSVFATTYKVCTDKNYQTIPIGQPIPNAKLYVVDENGLLQPIGVPGELWIGGDGVSMGYLNQPKLTAEKFIENPFGKGRVYKSGDLVKWNVNGEIEYIKRIDEQLKIRGFRVELGEIENVIRSVKGVNHATVIVKGESTDKRLVAYIVHEPHVTKENIKDEIALFMPDFMVPSYFVSMEEIPRNMNGKIDKSKLPDIEMINETEIVLPENELEEQLLRIWQEVLGDTNFGITNKFFELGGNSLKAIQVINRVRQELMIELTVKDLFGKDTIKELADTVLEKQLEDFDDDELLGLLEE